MKNPQIQVWINDSLIDLVPDQVIAKTIQAFDMWSPLSVKANYTNQFKALKTSNNRKIFQFVDDEHSSGNIPYSSATCRIIQNGVELVGNGTAQIMSTDSFYNIVVFDGNYSIFSKLQTQRIYNLDTSAYDGVFTDWRTVKANTSGGVGAIYNNGNVVSSGGNVQISYVAPSFFLYTLIQVIASTFGFTWSGNIFSNAKFLKMVIPTGGIISKYYRKRKEFNASADGSQTGVVIAAAGVATINFPKVSLQDTDGCFVSPNFTEPTITGTGANSHYLAAFAAVVTIKVTALGVAPYSISVDVFNSVTGVLYTSTILTTPVVNGIYQFVAQPASMESGFNISGGSVTTVRLHNNSANAITVNVVSGTFYNKLPSAIPSASAGQWTFFNHVLPDLSIPELLSNWANIFGLLFKENKGTIYIKNIDELINDTANAVDWTTKRDTMRSALENEGQQIVFQFTNLAQKNTFKWGTDSADSLSSEYASSSFTISNPNLPIENVQTSIFNASRTEGTLTLMMAVIPVYTITGGGFGTPGTPPSPRILLLRPYDATIDPGVYVSGLANTGYQVAYFIDATSNVNYQMTWAENLTNYAQYQIRMQKAKMVTRNYNLTDLDINNFDPFKLVYDNGAYYIVNQIINYIPGKSTKVELFKI